MANSSDAIKFEGQTQKVKNDLAEVLDAGHQVSAHFPAIDTAATTFDQAVFVADRTYTVTAVEVLFDDAVTGAETNNFGLRLRNKGTTAAGTDDIATKTYEDGVDAAKHVNSALTLDADEVTVADGEALCLQRFVNGTGMTSPAGVVTISYKAG